MATTPDDYLKLVEETAKKVYAELGEGYLESVYENAMAIEFRRAGVPYTVQFTAEILYQGEHVGVQKLDMILGERPKGDPDQCLAVELKAAASISKGHRAQTSAYLKTTHFTHGAIINFPTPAPAGAEPQVIRVPEELSDAAYLRAFSGTDKKEVARF